MSEEQHLGPISVGKESTGVPDGNDEQQSSAVSNETTNSLVGVVEDLQTQKSKLGSDTITLDASVLPDNSSPETSVKLPSSPLVVITDIALVVSGEGGNLRRDLTRVELGVAVEEEEVVCEDSCFYS